MQSSGGVGVEPGAGSGSAMMQIRGRCWLSGPRRGKRWFSSGCFAMVELTVLDERLAIGYEKKAYRIWGKWLHGFCLFAEMRSSWLGGGALRSTVIHTTFEIPFSHSCRIVKWGVHIGALSSRERSGLEKQIWELSN